MNEKNWAVFDAAGSYLEIKRLQNGTDEESGKTFNNIHISAILNF